MVSLAAARRAVTAVSHAPGLPICGDALSLPFADSSFDLVFCQFVLVWLEDLEKNVSEIHRVLEPKGVLIALEPDYEGMIEHPPEIATRDVWLSALERAGAVPCVGRMLPGLLAEQGFAVRVDLLDSLVTPTVERFEFLRTLSLKTDEEKTLEQVVKAENNLLSGWVQIVHLPFFLISASI